MLIRRSSITSALVALMVLFAPVAGTAQSAQAQSTWDAIQDRGSLRVGATQAPPG